MAKLWFLTKQSGFTPFMLTLAVICSLFSGSALAEEYRAWPGEFMRMGAGAKAMGMGNAYTAVEGDIYSSYFNPAGLAAMVDKQFTLSARYLSMDRKFMHLAYGSRIGPDADFAISWIQSGTDDIVSRDLNGNPTGSLEDKRNSISMTFSKDAFSWLSFGINTKLALWKLASEDARTYGFDVGVIARPLKKLSLSFVMRDINSKFTWKSSRWKKFISGADGQSLEKEDKFPVYYTLGVAYKAYSDRLLLSATLENVEDNPLGFNLGAAYEVTERFALRTGIYNYTQEEGFDSGSMTYGFSLGLTANTGFDYAYVPDDFTGNSLHIISLVMSYGE